MLIRNYSNHALIQRTTTEGKKEQTKQPTTKRAAAKNTTPKRTTPKSAALRLLLAVVLVLGMSPLTGCKNTDVLTEVAYTDNTDLLTDTLQWQFLKNADPNPDFSSQTSMESPRIDEQTPEDPTYDENPNTPDAQTDETQHNDQNNKDFNAAKGDAESQNEGNNEKSKNAGGLLSNLIRKNITSGDGGSGGSGGSKKNDKLSGDTKEKGDGSADSGGSDDSSNSKRPGDGSSTGGDEGKGDGGQGKEYGGDGTYDSLPHSGRVAACGQFALIVQMLGGQGALAAADSDWLGRVQNSVLFPGEGLDQVATGWNGTSANLQTIKDSGAEVVLLERNTNYLSNDEIQELTDSGISVVHMPRLGRVDTSQNDINTAVQAIGEIMKGATSIDSARAAATYVQMVATTTNNVQQQNGGTSGRLAKDSRSTFINADCKDSKLPTDKVAEYNTTFIDNWASCGVSSYLGVESWNGAHDFYLNGKTVDCSDGVGVSLANSEQKAGETCALLDYYLQYAGVGDQSMQSSELPDLPRVQFIAATEAGTSLGLSIAHSMWTGGAHGLWAHMSGSTDNESNYTYIGLDNYPAVIVRDSSYAQTIVRSSEKQYGFYNSGKAYRVFVMPSGVAGCWVDGNVESFLIAPWAYTWFQCYNSARYSCESYIDSFYSTFYRCSFSDARASGIVTGYDEQYQAGGQWL